MWLLIAVVPGKATAMYFYDVSVIVYGCAQYVCMQICVHVCVCICECSVLIKEWWV